MCNFCNNLQTPLKNISVNADEDANSDFFVEYIDKLSFCPSCGQKILDTPFYQLDGKSRIYNPTNLLMSVPLQPFGDYNFDRYHTDIESVDTMVVGETKIFEGQNTDKFKGTSFTIKRIS